MHFALQPKTQPTFPLKSIFEASLFEQQPAPLSLKSACFLGGALRREVEDEVEIFMDVEDLVEMDREDEELQLNEQLRLR